MKLIPVERLQQTVRLVMRGFGSSEAEAGAVATHLIDANLSGHDSHGIGMLPRYADAFLEGGLVPNMQVRGSCSTAATAPRSTARPASARLSAARRWRSASNARKAHGSCIVALGTTHHLGRIGAWAEQGRRRRGWCRCTSSTFISRADRRAARRRATRASEPTRSASAYRLRRRSRRSSTSPPA